MKISHNSDIESDSTDTSLTFKITAKFTSLNGTFYMHSYKDRLS